MAIFYSMPSNMILCILDPFGPFISPQSSLSLKLTI
jgi:hypothetical protein